jgi:hypothetical protein
MTESKISIEESHHPCLTHKNAIVYDPTNLVYNKF